MAKVVIEVDVDAKGAISGIRQLDSAADRAGKSTTKLQGLMKRVFQGVGLGVGLAAFTALTSAPAAAVDLLTTSVAASTRASIEYEEAFAGVRKTLNASESEFRTIDRQLITMSKRLPVVATELAGIAESAGQLGVAAGDVGQFTLVVAGAGIATDLAATQAATGFARLDAILSKGRGEFERTASALVDLGNNSAATESEILDLALGFAPIAEQMRLTRGETLGFAAAIRSVGIESEAGASAISRSFIEMQQAVLGGGETLEVFARIAGKTTSEFAELFRRDAAAAMVEFLAGLDRVGEAGGNVFEVLDQLNLSEIRVRKTVLALASAHEQAAESIGRGNRAFEENAALAEEVAKRNETTASQLQRLENDVFAVKRAFGDALDPVLKEFLRLAKELVGDLDRFVSKISAAEGETGRLATAARDLVDALRFVKDLSLITIDIGMSPATQTLLKAIPGLGVIPSVVSALAQEQQALDRAARALDLEGPGPPQRASQRELLETIRRRSGALSVGAGEDILGPLGVSARDLVTRLSGPIKFAVSEGAGDGLADGLDRGLMRVKGPLEQAIEAAIKRGIQTAAVQDLPELLGGGLAFPTPGLTDFSRLMPLSPGSLFRAAAARAVSDPEIDLGFIDSPVPAHKGVLGGASTQTFDFANALQGATLLVGAFGGEMRDLPQVIGNVADSFEHARDSADKFSAIALGIGQIGGLIGGRAGSAIQGAAGGALTGFSIGGPVGAAIGGGLGLISGLFGRGAAEELNDIRDAFFETQGGFIELQRSIHAAGGDAEGLVARIFDARTVEEFNAAVEVALGLLDTQAQAQRALEEAVQRYGISIEELGPKFQQQKLDEMAGQLIKDFRILTASGIDQATVLERMAPAMNEYIRTALAAGAAIPEAMRGPIEKLIEMGLLLDPEGNPFGSLEEAGITFTQTLTEGLAQLILKIDELVAALTGVEPVKVPVELDTSGIPGGIPGFPGGIPSYANEAFVSKPTLAVVGDVPGGEYVLRKGTVDALASRRAPVTVQMGGITITVQASGVSDPEKLIDELSEGLEREALPRFKAAIQRAAARA